MNLEEEVQEELIYDCGAFKDIKEKWPKAIQEDARDYTHPDRIVVHVPGTTYREYYNHALDKGYYSVSLSFQLLLLQGEEKEFHQLVTEWIEKKKVEKIKNAI